MAEETKEAIETNQPVIETEQPVTDSDLSSALETEEVKEEPQKEEVTGEQPQEPEISPTVPEEPEDHKERTRLGRKVAKLEENLTRVLGTFEDYINQQRLAQMNKPVAEPEPEETIVSTNRDVEEIVRRVIQKETAQQRQQREKYQLGYYMKMKELGGKDQTLYPDIEKEMLSNFNSIHTGNPEHDALINFSQAKASVMAKKISVTKPKVPVADEKLEAPTSLTSTTRVKPVETPMPKLSEETKKLVDYCRRQGMSEEEIKEALREESTIGLQPPTLVTK